MIRDCLETLVDGRDLAVETMEAAMDAILDGRASAAEIAAFLVGLRMKGETVDELAAAARVMRRHAIAVPITAPPPVLDTCGTGGDGSGTFNISTVVAIVVAAAGVSVAKHGNRAASSACGSADVLEAMGLSLDLSAEQIGRSIDRIGIGFMFARLHHPAMKHAAPVRADLGIRTLFNFLGPLSNPAGPTHQLLGVGDPARLEPLAEVLGRLGARAAWVVHGHGGLDEVALSGPTRVAALRGGQVRCFEVQPSDFGVEAAPMSAIAGGDATHNARLARSILEGERGPRRDAVLVNAAAALCAAEVASSPHEGAQQAAEAIDSGAAKRKLAEWIAFEG